MRLWTEQMRRRHHAYMTLEACFIMPIAVILREYIQNNTQSSGSGGTTTLPVSMKMATVVVATLPIVCIYPFLQKFFINGLMVGSVKG